MELLESVGPRPRQARYQAALRPDSMHIDDSTLTFGFPPSDLNSDCAFTVHIALAFELPCTLLLNGDSAGQRA